MKYAAEMGSGAMIYIKIGSGIRNLIGISHRHTGSLAISKAYFYFFKIRKVG
jgi:hypothetical protein